MKSGNKVVTPFFICFIDDASESDIACFALIASKKTFKRAVDRNFARRRLKGLIRKFNLAPLNYIFIARHILNTTPFNKLEQAFAKLPNLR